MPFDVHLQRHVTAGKVPGLSMGLVRRGELCRGAAFGVRSYRSREPVSPHTVFEAASLSKPLFTYAVLQLVDSGVLSLDEPLSIHNQDYIPGDGRASRITARHVLAHTTGLPNWRRSDHLTVHFPPGERFSYSGEAFVYLQKTIELITNEPLDSLITRLVFAPLEMSDSSFTWQERFEVDFATPHDRELQPKFKGRPAKANAAFSLQTTALDYARFLGAVVAGAGLKDTTSRLWLQPGVHVPKGRTESTDRNDAPELDDLVAWGLGWGLEPATGAFFHWGANPGFEALAVGSPHDDAALVVFTNCDGGLLIMPQIVKEFLPGDRPSLRWLGLDA